MSNDMMESVSEKSKALMESADEALEIIKHSGEVSAGLLEGLAKTANHPEGTKSLKRRFNVDTTAKLVRRTKTAIYDAEKEGRLPHPDMTEKNRRIGYTLEQISHMREVFGTQPYRAETDEPIILQVGSFKGGTAKTTTTIHLAHDLAIKGYRVLVIDCDPQATTTTLFGHIPDAFEAEETVYVAFSRVAGITLRDVILNTYWENIDLAPCSLALYRADLDIYRIRGATQDHFAMLRMAINEVKYDYDVVLIDPPPSLGTIGLNVISATEGLIVPLPAMFPDLASASTYFFMMEDMFTSLEKGVNKGYRYKFIKLLVTRYDNSRKGQQALVDTYHRVFKEDMLDNEAIYSSAIEQALMMQRSLFEMDKGMKGYGDKAYRRAYESFEAVCDEIEVLIRKTWPSHRPALLKEGHLTREEVIQFGLR